MFRCDECNKTFARRDSLLRHTKRRTHLTGKIGKEIVTDDDDGGQPITYTDGNVENPTEIIYNKILAMRKNRESTPLKAVSQQAEDNNDFSNTLSDQIKTNDNQYKKPIFEVDQDYFDTDNDETPKCTSPNELVNELRYLLSTKKTCRRVFEIIKQLKNRNIIV